ncbi:MAG: hypothetical protein LWX54_10580 [Deltaproteobacteria bacterium]|jgi:hypothetical protein|nr:hypothetical protein [Deltaproteobacteria bacterium]
MKRLSIIVFFLLLTAAPFALWAQTEVAVWQESSPGAGDFDENFLGHIEVFDQTESTAAEVYQYNGSYNGSVTPSLADTTQFFLVDTSDGLSLFVVHDKPYDGDGGRAQMRFELSGDPDGAARLLEDDVDDRLRVGNLFGPDIFQIHHFWYECCTDGVVIGALDDPWSMLVSFSDVDGSLGNEFLGVSSWVATSADGTTIPLELSVDRRVLLQSVNGWMGETIKLPANYEFVIEQNTEKEFQIQLFNTWDDPQSATLELINPHQDITVSLTQQDPITIAPGDVQDIALVVNAGETVGRYDDVLLKVTVENDAVLYSNISVIVVEQGAESMLDLSISSQDIQLIDYALGVSVDLGALVHNDGLLAASNVQVRFYEFGNLLGETVLADVPAGTTRSAFITAPITTPGEHLIQVVVDYADAIEEYDEDNNKASQIIRLGDPVSVSGTILVTGSLPSTVYTNGLFTVSGRAIYDIYIDEVRYTNYVVQGGSVQITIRDTAGNEWVYGGVHTDINGYFSKTVQAPAITGDYQLSMTVTDETLTGERELAFSVIEPPPLPVSQFPVPSYGEGTWVFVPADGTWIWVWSELPVNAPILESDLRVFSENIHFSEFNPEEGDDITIFAEINYWATSTALVALNVPINFYATYPGTPKMKIGETIIDSLSVGPPDFGSRYVYASWRNLNEGIYIVEIEIDPSYVESNMLNNAATRAIIVGDLECFCGAITGQVTDPWGGVGNIVIELYDSSGTTLLDTRNTCLTGYYLFENIPVGEYQVHIVKPDDHRVDAETKPANLIDQSIVEVDFYLIKQLEVEIDIKPGSELNHINLSSAGVIPVAILSSENFDATTVDPDTVTLAGAAVKIIGQGDSALVREDDVNGDELVDLVCYVITAEFMIETGESIAELEASTFDGTLIHGEDNVVIVADS